MKFGPVAVEEAEGCILAHKTALPGRVLHKGHLLDARDCADLCAAQITKVTVARLEPGDIGEDAAAERLARASMGAGIDHDRAATGRMNLFAATDGVLLVDADAVTRANRIDPAITFATLPAFSRVSAGRMVATAKIISFALAGEQLRAAEDALAGAVRIAAFHPRKVGLVATMLPHLKPATMDKTRRVLEDRLRPSGSMLIGEKRVAHDTDAVAEALRALAGDGADFLVLFGASAIVDRQDVLPSGLDRAGGAVRRLGMPVDPGNLLMLGALDGAPVLGAPGCARSPKENGFDWVLDRLLADLDVTEDDVTAMGVGGLLMEIGTRPRPREVRSPAPAPKIAAVVLAAGRSSRMGGPNKLLATLEDKPLIRHAVEAAHSAGLSQTVVVTGHLANEVGAEVADLDVELVHNPDFAEGMSGSIRRGITALGPEIDAAVILLGDMPRIDAGMIGRLVAAYRPAENKLIVTATSDGKRGNPVLWDRSFFDRLTTLSGDIGARHVIGDNAGLVAEVDLGPAARLDLDTPEALLQAGGRLPDTQSASNSSK